MSRLNIAIGQYVPGQSIVHRLDPRTKFIAVFTIMILVFVANNTWTFAALCMFVAAAIFSSRISLPFLAKGLKPVWIILCITFFFHLWLTREGEVLWQWAGILVYEEGVRQALIITLRITLLVIMASLLTLTTKPLVLTHGLETLMRPLAKLRFPVHEFAFMISIALRFIPTFMQELEKLIKAQSARGARFTDGPLWKRVIHFVPVLIPLFISAFQRADDLALAMEARAYQGGEGRTQLYRLSFSGRDILVAAVVLLLLILVLFLRT